MSSTTEVASDWTLTGTIALRGAKDTDTTAVRCGTAALTYGELDTRSAQLAGALRTAGIGVGDRIAFLGKESTRYYEVLFAAARTGAVLVPINWRLADGEVRHILEDSGARLLFVDASHPTAGSSPAREVVADSADYEAFLQTGEADGAEHRPTPDTPVAQLYTSGTTGLPKGVVLAHRSFFAIAASLAENGLDWIDWKDGDVALIGIPGFHVGGLWFAAQAFNVGATVVALPAFEPALARRTMMESGVTSAIFVPSMMRSILVLPGVAPVDFKALRKVIYGGAPISETLLEQSLRVFEADFAQIYGLTETGNTAICLPPSDHVPGSHRLRAAGRPYPAVRVKVVDPAGVEVATGETGEVCLHTPAAMLEYWNRPDANAKTLRDGWIHTGDAGSLDADGYLYIQDRLNDLIIVAGENVYPAELENVLAAHPGVGEVAVVGVPDDLAGESIVAYVVVKDGHTVTSRDLVLFLRPRVAGFKLPSAYHFIDAIPRNPSGKILRRELREPHWAGRERRVN